MVDDVFVGISSGVLELFSGMTDEQREKVAQDVNLEIRLFFEHKNQYPIDSVALCIKIASLYSETAVASHVVVDGTLRIFIDVLHHGTKSKFLYTPHSQWMH